MDIKARQSLIVSVPLIFTMAAYGVLFLSNVEGFWGINHLKFLPSFYSIAYIVDFAMIVVISMYPRQLGSAERLIDSINDSLWGRSKMPRLFLALASAFPFFIFRIEVPLLGDGWTLLSIFGQGHSYILKWSEAGSILVLRSIQYLLGGYTHETAMVAFQIMSIISGAIFVYNITGLIGNLCRSSYGRFLTLTTILFSGATLLFLRIYRILSNYLGSCFNLSQSSHFLSGRWQEVVGGYSGIFGSIAVARPDALSSTGGGLLNNLQDQIIIMASNAMVFVWIWGNRGNYSINLAPEQPA